MTRRSYSELVQIDSYEDRFEYLSLRGYVGERTFGGERWINQDFYRSREWKHIRNVVIARDLGCDMAMEGFDLFETPRVHHMNPMDANQIRHGDTDILNPEYLITVSHKTHNAIHYGDRGLLIQLPVERRPGDTMPWRQ